jgi:alkane 1-monooxygenase
MAPIFIQHLATDGGTGRFQAREHLHMARLRYLTPFVFLALLPLGGWLGGAWTFLAAAATPLCLTSLDSVLGEDRETEKRAGARASRWLPRTYVVLQLAATAWAATLATRPQTSLLETVGLCFSAGVTTGVFGFVAAHEMIHSREARERALGLVLLASVFYMHFRIAHVYGHHRRAATTEDPASARLGEGLYAFLARSVAGQFREAWAFEARRPRNRMVVYLAIEAALLGAVALINVRALVFLLAVAVVAVVLLESFNYVAHYGLRRRPGERLGPQHSWNSARRMNNAALFNMGRHSDHHRRLARSYERLEALSAAAELPSGYAAALLTALMPPLWRRVMDPRAKAAQAAGSRGTP